jgi:hypothetical protein
LINENVPVVSSSFKIIAEIKKPEITKKTSTPKYPPSKILFRSK